MRHDDLNDTYAATGGEPLGRLDDYEMADGYPDVRGWKVTTADGRDVGTVKELLCDVGALEVRYLVVDRDGVGTGDLRIPVARMRLNEDSDRVIVDAAYVMDSGLAASDTIGAAMGSAAAAASRTDAASTGFAADVERPIARADEALAPRETGSLGIRRRLDPGATATERALDEEVNGR